MSAQIDVTWLTNTTDMSDHALTDAEFARGRRDEHGEYRALCGQVLLPCSMLVPPGPPCPRCSALVCGAAPSPAGDRR